MASPGNRRRSRELALHVLYAHDITGESDIEGLISSTAEIAETGPECVDFARALVDQAIALRERIDALMQQHAANWEIRRMAAIDRNVLRMAVAELLTQDTPYKVVIDEAVEIAKTFGAEDSGKFVNGILDSIRKQITVKQGDVKDEQRSAG